ncbi:ABC transporter permease [Paenibacillus oenotherae]|uniref:ABC transporter permease n=1 Tax=Paenibacillus oenotherae TaxID=1435645 RepID=A0ABS7DBU2_9BACL|nr:ABC transporter permease subunit [Paenibacillus oenotherae]MBW7477355.1 ABC transporter permease [Paenibacillus oenotherae]
MFSLTANIRNEMHKWWLHRKTKWFLLAIVLLPVGFAWLIANVQVSMGISAIIGTDFPLIMLGLLTTILLPLYLFMTAADSFSGESAARTMKIVLVRPITRSKIFASKVISLIVIAIITLAGGWLASLLSGLFLENSWSLSGIWDGAAAYMVALVPMAVVAIFAALVAQWFQSSTTAIILCIAIYGALKLLPYLLPQASVWSPFAYTDWYSMWLGNGVSFMKLFSVFVFLLSCSIIVYMAGLLQFARRQY